MRDTCLCIKHENMKLMCQKMKQLRIVNDKNIDYLIKTEICCAEKPMKEACVFRECVLCKDNWISFLEFDGEADSYYESGESVEEKRRDGKMHKRIAKTRIMCQVTDMVTKFYNMIQPYMIHVGNMKHQHVTMKGLKRAIKLSMDSKSLLIHIDFSENYQCKYTMEIQSVHFGNNRAQVILHTGVAYSAAGKHSFCTISPDLAHDPVAILKHLKPILSQEAYKDMQYIHFLSDSPSTQYRNQFMYYVIITYMVPLFRNLKHLS